uniref:Transferrin receptor protein 1 n=1 Tax=Cacopsylla melanoneura TaxID=428564 RepID=A0A8D8VRY2_9HEMI
MRRVLSLPQLARNTYNESSDFVSKRMCFSFLLAIALMTLGVGYMAGRVATIRLIEQNAIICKAAENRLLKSHLDAGKNLENNIKQESIAGYYRDLNAYDPAGPGDLNYQQAAKLVKHFKESQFDSVSKVVASQVRLTFPDPKNASIIAMLNGDEVVYRSPNSPSAKYTIPSGQKYQKLTRRIEGEPVYINYGTARDYDFLNKVNIDIHGKVAIVRMGKVPLYQQITEALSLGATGVLLFHDPKSYIYTDTIVLSPTLLGRIQLLFGDPSANSSTFDEESINSSKSIAVSVINVELAEYILARMKVVSTDYNPLSHYPISQGFNDSNWKLVLDFNYVNVLHTYHNVIGAIRGLEEPDRYVLMGSSRASLETNATDVLGATAAMMEIAKIFGNLKKNKNCNTRGIAMPQF